MRAVIAAIVLCTAGVAQAAKYECLVEPYVEVNISTEVEGILGEVYVDRGDFVQKDQVLARLRSDLEEAQLRLAKARAEFAVRRASRNEELYLKQMISPHERDELETDSLLLKMEVEEVEERLRLRTITSPIDGVVMERTFHPGEFVSDLPFLKLAQIDPLRVEVALPIELYGKVRVGMIGTVEWEAPVADPQKATVKVVDPVVDAASGTIGVRLELPNPNRRLPAGTKCWVEFPLD